MMLDKGEYHISCIDTTITLKNNIHPTLISLQRNWFKKIANVFVPDSAY